MAEAEACTGKAHGEVEKMGLRIGAIFVVFASSAIVTLFPIVTKRIPKLSIPLYLYEFAKFFGSGVIIATAFIHLLVPAADELSQECLNEDFQHYPMAYAFALISMMILFMAEFFAYRLGSKYVGESGNNAMLHHHAPGHNDAHAREEEPVQQQDIESEGDLNHQDNKLTKMDSSADCSDLHKSVSSGASEVIGVFILEFGIIFHSVIIGLTLATAEYEEEPGEGGHGHGGNFKVLFPVIVFHQLFEGLGLGARLAFLPTSLGATIPVLLGLAYAIVTPIGMAIGLGLRQSYSQDTPVGYYVTGIFDAISAGILIYTGMVELLAHDFIFSDKMRRAPVSTVAINMFAVCLGIAIMSVIGKWA